jgi:predicted RNA-binding protein with PIN domain
MRRVVDGMNVIGSRPDGWWRDRTGAMRRLAAALDRLAARTGDTITLVLDGRPRDVGAPDAVDVVFAPGGPNAADDEIARRVAADDDPGSLVVTTSDGDLVRRVTEAGGRVEGSGTLRRRLDELSP